MRALLIVDVQNDFLPKGALAVPHADEIIPFINVLQKNYELVVASKDWHPKGHISFASTHGKRPGEKIQVGHFYQHLWPDHCLQGTFGAEFPEALNLERIEQVFYKGVEVDVDSYSAFFDNLKERSTGLDSYLREKGVERVDIVGLASDYCVKYSALDALSLGFEVGVYKEGCRGIDVILGDVEGAYLEMIASGASVY